MVEGDAGKSVRDTWVGQRLGSYCSLFVLKSAKHPGGRLEKKQNLNRNEYLFTCHTNTPLR